jgi:hypothetical protein
MNEGKVTDLMKWNWKWAVGLGGAVLLVLYLSNNPGALKGISRWMSNPGGGGYPGRERVSRAELAGKLDKALLFATEVNDRLSAYKAQFDCPDGQLLDSLFFDGALANHPLRPTWWELRRELPEIVRKHQALLEVLNKARASVSRGEDIQTWEDLPEEAEQASRELDAAIRDRNRKVFQFAVLVNQIKLQMAIQERRNRR